MSCKLLFCSKFSFSKQYNPMFKNFKFVSYSFFILYLLQLLLAIFSHSLHFSLFPYLFFFSECSYPLSMPFYQFCKAHFKEKFFFFWNLMQPHNPLVPNPGSSGVLNSEFFEVHTETVYTLCHYVTCPRWSLISPLKSNTSIFMQ